MKIRFYKYHALGNDFILIENHADKVRPKALSSLARRICSRNTGIGADGLLVLGKSKKSLPKIDIYNSDGGWAERSGNGLRIAGLHLLIKSKSKKNVSFIMGGEKCQVSKIKSFKNGALFTTELGVAQFETRNVPVKSKSQFMINAPLKVNDTAFPVTCLSVGNPHTVLFVENFYFDWQEIGAAIESHPVFPKGTNVEFVKVLSRKKLCVKEWERGAGATSSSGTGAAAAVAASVMLGLAERKCSVEFETGKLTVSIRKSDDVTELTGPAEFICEGIYELP